MHVLGAGLGGQQHHLLGADTVGIDIHHQLQTDLIHLAETEVCNLHIRLLLIGEDDVRLFKIREGTGYLFIVLMLCHNVFLPYLDSIFSISLFGRMPSTELSEKRLHAAAEDANARMRSSS